MSGGNQQITSVPPGVHGYLMLMSVTVPVSVNIAVAYCRMYLCPHLMVPENLCGDQTLVWLQVIAKGILTYSDLIDIELFLLKWYQSCSAVAL